MIPVAVVGVGQTHHRTRRRDVSVGGMVREAVFRALEDAQMTMDDIDAVVLGKAPDLFEGIMKPELYLSDALGAVGKPMFRVHTAGSVGGTTGIVAASHVQAGKHRRVLACSEANLPHCLSWIRPRTERTKSSNRKATYCTSTKRMSATSHSARRNRCWDGFSSAVLCCWLRSSF